MKRACMFAVVLLAIASPPTFAQAIRYDGPLLPTPEPVLVDGDLPYPPTPPVDSPEPATWILAVTGASAVALWRRRGKKVG